MTHQETRKTFDETRGVLWLNPLVKPSRSHHHFINFYGWCVEFSQWKFQDPKMEVLYHIRPYLVGIFPYIALKQLALYMVGTSNLGS
jgi:hypothetical protein